MFEIKLGQSLSDFGDSRSNNGIIATVVIRCSAKYFRSDYTFAQELIFAG